jgi:acetoacetate decarboxylase
MKKLNKTQISTLNSIRNSKGRFFGLYTKQGEAINAQFRGETDAYVDVYDRNNKRTRRIAKSSIATA